LQSVTKLTQLFSNWPLTRTGKEIATLRGHEGEVLSADFSPDGGRIVTASTDKTARIWDLASRKEIAVLRGDVRHRASTVSLVPSRQ
jgi:WD40 repeat protein